MRTADEIINELYKIRHKLSNNKKHFQIIYFIDKLIEWIILDRKEQSKTNDNKNKFYLYISKDSTKDSKESDDNTMIVGEVDWISDNIYGARRDICSIMSSWERFKEIVITTKPYTGRETLFSNRSVYEYLKEQKKNGVDFTLRLDTELSYEYLRGWYDGAREVMKILSKGDNR